MIPWAMIWLRAALGPVILICAWRGWPGYVLSIVALVALADDVLDGMLARQWGTDTARLRLADSTADTVFYLGAAGALWLRFPAALRADLWLLALLFLLEGVRLAFDFWKFHKSASYHSYLAKLWGLVLAAAIVSVFIFAGAPVLIWTAIVLGIAANLEGLAMSFILPRWQNDVKTLSAAWRLRRKMLGNAELR